MQVKSIGDDVVFSERHSLVLHSSFKNAVNFVSEDGKLLSVVTERVGEGPNNIVLRVPDVSAVSRVEILPEGKLVIQGNVFDANHIPRYDSFLDGITKTDREYFEGSLLLFKETLFKKAPLLSSAFLLDDRRKHFFITPFEKNLYAAIKKHTGRFFSRDISAISDLKGLGFGLTPQGDDIINGFVIALFVFGKAFEIETRKQILRIYEYAKGSNIISDTFLSYSVSGRFYSKVKNLITSLFFDRNKIEACVNALVQIGETSGSDIGTGFVLMMEKLLQGGTEWL